MVSPGSVTSFNISVVERTEKSSNIQRSECSSKAIIVRPRLHSEQLIPVPQVIMTIGEERVPNIANDEESRRYSMIVRVSRRASR